jgi:signal transduction histidine kinase
MEPSDLHLASALAGVAVASAYVCVGLLGLALHRYRLPHAWLFTLTCLTFAWATAIAPMQPLVAARHPWIYALSTGLSGYAAPALMLFTSRAVHPRRPLSLAWLLLGVPGTAFSVLALTDAERLGFLVDFREPGGPRWHAVLSPLYLAHFLETLGATTVSTWLVLRQVRVSQEGTYRTALKWLAATHVGGWIGIVAYSLLPGVFGVVEVIELAPWMLGMPALSLLFRSLTALSDAAATRPRAEAAARNLSSVANALRGMSERVGKALSDIAEHAHALQGPAGPAEHRSHVAGVRQACSAAERTVQRMLRFAATAPYPSDEVRIAPRLRAAAARHADQVTTVVSVDPEAEGALARVDTNAFDDALDALLTNAFEACREGPGPPNHRRAAKAGVRIQAALERPATVDARALGAELDGTDALRITVADDGHGMAPEVLEQALVPFFTTKPGSAGLGCVDVVTTVRTAGGALLMESARGVGTTVTLWLPVSPPPDPSSAPAAGDAGTVPGVVLVAADARIAELLHLLLDARGIESASFRPIAAVHVLERAAGFRSVVLVLDRRDPSLEDLLVLAGRLVTRRPDVDLFVVGAPPDVSRSLRLLGGDRVFTLRQDTSPGRLVARVVERVRAEPTGSRKGEPPTVHTG